MELSKYNQGISRQSEQEEQQQLLAALLGSSPVITVNDALESDSKQLSTIGHEFDQETALDILKIFITSLVNAFNVGKTMTEAQIDDACLLILEDFWHLKVSDFQLFVKQAKKGRYGKLYDRIDCPIIIEWITAYDEERMEAAAKRKPKAVEALEEIKPPAELPVSQAISSLYRKVKPDYPPKPEPRPLNPIQQMHNRWMDQFSELYDRQQKARMRLTGSIISGKAYVKKYGRTLDITEYLEYKQGQYNTFTKR